MLGHQISDHSAGFKLVGSEGLKDKSYKGEKPYEAYDYENYICKYISDFLFFIEPEVQKNFNEEQLIIKDVLRKLNANKRNQSLSKTLENQREKENEMKQFKRIMSGLQDESVIKKTERQKRQLYNEKVKKEKEEKKKEEEKKLEKLGII